MEPLRTETTVWDMGDYHAFAKATVWPMGPVLVDACEIAPGQRVLDVAAGSGNTAIRAAEAGASVVACDLATRSLEAGRREAEGRGLAIDWVVGDAEDLPFADGEFDVVASSFGAMFAPRQERVADELVRVCRPGGTIGMLNFTPQGLIGDFFAALAPYAPAPEPGASPPPLWGDEEHVRTLFGDRVDALALRRGEYTERVADPAAYRDLLRTTFGPIVAMYEAIRDDRAARAALDDDLLAFARRADSGRPGGPAEYVYEYLLVVTRRAGG